MGIFSLFGKKERQPAATAATAPSARRKREEAGRNLDPADDIAREQAAQGQRQAARATALKIDAIESEMSSEFVRPAVRAVKPPNTPVPSSPSVSPAAPAAARVEPPMGKDDAGFPELQERMPAAVVDTLFPTQGPVFDTPAVEAAVEDVPLFEEVAILFANGQSPLVEQLLQEAIEADDLGAASVTAWGMLFDLYQINGDQAQFEHLSIAYASRFETSPPAWIPPAAPEPVAAPRAPAVPSVAFSGRLDAGIVKTLEKARTLADRNPTLRLEFTRITDVDPIGCGLLLRVLNQLQKSNIDLILVGAPELVARIRAILAVGRRDETEAPWLLLMELLALLNQETAFEEASIDYCVTFEISPPSFVPPKNKVTTAMEEPAPDTSADDVFRMPPVIEGRTSALVAELGAFVSRHDPARVDCMALARVDVNAAGQLLSGLAPLAGDNRSIEFFNVNHLVAALFNVMGLKQIVRVTTRRI